MARYFLHLRDSIDELLDPEGVELPDVEALRKCVLETVRDLISGDVRDGVIDLRYRIEAENEAGQVVYVLHFRHAFTIIPEPGGGATPA
jgi:hypothetical protein